REVGRFTQTRGALLFRFVVMLRAVGALAEKDVSGGVLVVLVFGGLGWVMAGFDWPRPPLLLGLVLGPLAENKLFLSTDNYGLAWTLRPGVLVLLAIIVAGFLVPIITERRRKRREGTAVAVAPEATRLEGPRGMRLDGATAFSAVIVALFAWALWQSRTFGPRAGLFPW